MNELVLDTENTETKLTYGCAAKDFATTILLEFTTATYAVLATMLLNLT